MLGREHSTMILSTFLGPWKIRVHTKIQSQRLQRPPVWRVFAKSRGAEFEIQKLSCRLSTKKKITHLNLALRILYSGKLIKPLNLVMYMRGNLITNQTDQGLIYWLDTKDERITNIISHSKIHTTTSGTKWRISRVFSRFSCLFVETVSLSM